MSQRRRQPRRTTTSRDDQITNMINELYGTEENMQTGTFSISSYASTPPSELFGTRTTTMNTLTNVTVPSVSGQQENVIDDDNDSPISTIHEKYHTRTLGPHNITRMSILPIFPPIPVTITRMTSPRATSAQASHLLLSNVPIDSLSAEQYARVRYDTYPRLFRLTTVNVNVDEGVIERTTQLNMKNSFLLSFYHDLYEKTKKRLKVDIPVIDFNLTRLRHCIDLVVVQRGVDQTMLNMDELLIALEFYLQIDVDMFFLKTCSFNGVEPRLINNRLREGLFCLETPTARFAITPCNKRQCQCCRSQCPRHYATDPQQTSAIQFSIPHIHRFVNQYEAILNCPATCETKNCIYVLTCPCGQFDFIGESKSSFVETLTAHREEGNRIIREFLIGERNIEHLIAGLKSEKKKVNDKSWLYQHSSHCSAALQFFIDYNPDYWCFVPMKTVEVQMAHGGNIHGHMSRRPRMNDETASISSFATLWIRANDEVDFLVGNVPKPPSGFEFLDYQRQQQSEFFKWAKDRIVPAYNVDLYNADIVAILPDNSSKLFRKLIESLLITHAECKLNEIGNMIQTNTNPNRALRGTWCANLIRRPLPTLLLH